MRPPKMDLTNIICNESITHVVKISKKKKFFFKMKEITNWTHMI